MQDGNANMDGVEATMDRLNAAAPAFIGLLGGRLVTLDPGAQSCGFRFDVPLDYCHSGDIVQGGFVTAMLDAAMSHAVFACTADVVALSSLEISTRYLEAARAGCLFANGRVLRLSWKTAFLEGELVDAQGTCLATAQSVAKLRRSS